VEKSDPTRLETYKSTQVDFVGRLPGLVNFILEGRK